MCKKLINLFVFHVNTREKDPYEPIQSSASHAMQPSSVHLLWRSPAAREQMDSPTGQPLASKVEFAGHCKVH